MGWLGRFAADRRGTTVVVFAICLPILAVLAAGAVEIAFVRNDVAATQDAADAAALSGAKEMAIAANGADQRAQAFAAHELTGVAAHADVKVATSMPDANTMKVAVDTWRASFFGNLLPPGGFRTHVEAEAQSLGQTPLCVLVTGPASGGDLSIDALSQIQADCLVHGDQNLQVASGGVLAAEVSEAGGTASGAISPAALTGAPTIADPFAALNTSFPMACNGSGSLVTISVDQYLPAGVHCDDYILRNGVTLTLGAGEHYFGGNISLKNAAQVLGDDVVLVFAAGKTLDFKNASNISLNGRKSGPLAGFVIIVDRGDTGTFTLESDPFSNITGAIYSPNAELDVVGTKKAGQASSWTVVTARALKVTNGADLVINAGYAGTSVPVPQGVGPHGGGRVALVK